MKLSQAVFDVDLFLLEKPASPPSKKKASSKESPKQVIKTTEVVLITGLSIV